ncbi:MAG: ATP F0F1 synthase subunit B' [Rhodobacteraceae bacterium]|nr:MAG: ATP F0F1 synthase subunit B' [Paracoccaceae bacterium]
MAVQDAEQVVEASVGMPQLDFATFPNQIFWLVVSIVVLYFIVAKVALPRIGSVIEDRHNAVANDIEQAAEFKRKAEEAEAAYNAALTEARAQAMQIAGEAKAEIKADVDAAIAKADAEIAAKAAESAVRIDEIRASALKAIEEVAGVAANDIVAAIMPSAADDKALKAAVAARLKG